MTDINTVIGQVVEMKTATLAGKIPWASMNPNTFQWSKSLPGKGQVLTMLQKVLVVNPQMLPQGIPPAIVRRGVVQPGVVPGAGIQRDSYILTIRNQAGEVYLTINSQQQQVYEPALRELFQAAESSGMARGANIIAELLKDY